MKFKWKIYLLCMAIYIITLTATAVIVTENTYSRLVNREIERALQEEKNANNSAVLYLIANEKVSEDKLDIQDYSKRIVDMYGSENVIVELYNSDKHLIEASIEKKWSFNRDDLEALINEGRNYVIRRENNRSYIFINDLIKVDSSKLLMSYIKDISEVQAQRKDQYLLFLKTGIAGLVIIAIIVELLSRVLIKPIEELGKSAKKIAAGSFSERAEVKGEDEISDLGEQFNMMADEVEKRIVELEMEGERKQRFIDNLTHELRTPLTSVIGYSELLQKVNYDEAAFSKGLRYIHSEGTRMLRLINSLMEMILLRQGNLNLEKVNILFLLTEAAEIMQARTKEKNLDILIQGENLELNIDKDMIKGVILNLIDNSLKATTEGKKIIIGCEKSEQHYHIFVQDEGRGMEQNEIPWITEPFYRVDKSRARKEGGAGIGLALCKQIIESHGGELSIESELGKGTKVSIVLKNPSKGDVDIA
jgi:signal transduction histidine kinase